MQIGQVVFDQQYFKIFNLYQMYRNNVKNSYEAPAQMKRCKSLKPLIVMDYHLRAH